VRKEKEMYVAGGDEGGGGGSGDRENWWR